MTDTPLLRARGVRKSFGQVEVLKGIDLTVRQGQVVALIGASGSGKTTFLRCVNLLEEHDGGEILLDGEPVGYRGEGTARRRLSEARVSAGGGGARVLPQLDRQPRHLPRLVPVVAQGGPCLLYTSPSPRDS